MRSTPKLDLVAALSAVPGLGGEREVVEELAGSASQKTVAGNVRLVEQGKPPEAVLFLVRGAAKTVHVSELPRAEPVVLQVMRAPCLVSGASMLDGKPAVASVVTLRSSVVVSVELALATELFGRSTGWARFLLARAAHDGRAHVRRIDELVAGTVDERVKHLLAGLARDHGTPLGEGRFIALPLRRRDIANMVNATTETVSRLLAKLERQGLARSTRDGIWWRTAPAPAAASPGRNTEPASQSSDAVARRRAPP